jgi:outer membrane protein assembly factor BamA
MTAALVAVLALPATAQDQARTKNTARWRDSFYPYFPSLANDFPLIALHYEQRKAADYLARSPFAGLLSLDAGASWHGSRMALARFQAPSLWNDWRLNAALVASRATREGYFGLGNDTPYDGNLVTKSQPNYYRARRVRYLGEVELSRHLVGPLYLAAAGGLERSILSDLSGPSVFRTEQGTADVTDTDARGRFTLVLDARDNEFNATKGIFAQTSVTAGSGGGNYTRISGDLRGYVPIREGTVFAVRVAGANLSGNPPLNARMQLPEWENEVSVLGGTNSNRGLRFQRLTGKGVLLASAELRHDLLNLGDLGAFTLFAFADAGRVFEQTDFKLTTKDMKVGGGGGLAIRLLRYTIWTFNFATGPDGFQFSSGTGWAF